MPDLMVVQSGDLILYSGFRKRCRTDGVAVTFNFDNGARVVEETSDADGLLKESGISVSVQYTTVRITFTSPNYQTVAVRASITWTGGWGKLGLDAVHLEPK